jgi:DNA polymerase III subunit epsilon
VHGALLDSRLLAEVYLAMTRGQDGLAIGQSDASANASDHAEEPLALAPVLVLRASDDDLAAHEALLDDIAKAAKSTPVWRKLAA